MNLGSTVLGMRRFHGPHTGENAAKHFWDVISRYLMEQKIGYFTLDNASNNETALQQICSYLARMNLLFNPIHRRLRCFGHIPDPVLKGFLRAEDLATFDSQIIFYEELT